MAKTQKLFWSDAQHKFVPMSELDGAERARAQRGELRTTDYKGGAKAWNKDQARAQKSVERRSVPYATRMEAAHEAHSPTAEQQKKFNSKMGQALKGAAKGFADTFTKGAQDIRDALNARQQASMEKAHANRQAEIAENASAETGTFKQQAAQKANRNERVEAAKDAATNAASQARAQTASGTARAMGAGAASMQAAEQAARAADTSASISENRQRADTQAQQAASLAQTQAQQQANAEQMRQQGDEAVYAMGLQTRANMEKRKLAEAKAAQDAKLQEAWVEAWRAQRQDPATQEAQTTEAQSTEAQTAQPLIDQLQALPPEEQQTLLETLQKMLQGGAGGEA